MRKRYIFSCPAQNKRMDKSEIKTDVRGKNPEESEIRRKPAALRECR